MSIASTSDDLWFWAMALLNNKKIKIVTENITNFDSVFVVKNTTLWNTNIKGANDIVISKLLEKYPSIKDLLFK
jgi:hypothetical protein